MISYFFLYLFVFILGLAVGSFLNSVVYRLSIDKGFISGRSFCPHCRHKLAWQDLVPLLSFVLLGGKCRYCRKPISFQYPLVELGTGSLFLGIFYFFSINIADFYFLPWLKIVSAFFVASFSVIIFAFDLKYYLIPDKVIYPAIVATLIFDFFLNSHSPIPGFWLSMLGSAFGAAGFFLFIVLISKGQWMGVGDIKLAFLMGLFVGFPNILIALFFSFFLGAIIGLIMIVFKRKTLKSEVPFGPFLVTGLFIALFFGEMIKNWYFRLFL